MWVLSYVPSIMQPEINGSFYSGIKQMILAFILGSITEELLFRSFLKFSLLNLKLFLCTIIYISINYINIPIGKEYMMLVRFGSFILFFIIFTYIFRYMPVFMNKLKDFYVSKRLVIFYFFLISFSLIHLTSCSNLKMVQLLGISIFLVHILISGYIYSFIRIRYGLIYCIIMHISHNLALLLFF